MIKTDDDYKRAYKHLQQSFLDMWHQYSNEAAELVNEFDENEINIQVLIKMNRSAERMKIMREVVSFVDTTLKRATEGEI